MRFERKWLWLIPACLAASVAAIFGTLYVTYSRVRYPIVEGVQGRYFLPFPPLTVVLLAGALNTFRVRVTPYVYRRGSLPISILMTTSLVFAAAKYYFVTWG